MSPSPVFAGLAVFLLCLATVRAVPLDEQNPSNPAGVFCSPATVALRPAIAYTGPGGAGVKYIRAEDAVGAVWGSPVMVDAGPQEAGPVWLKVVSGNPAICYYDSAVRRIKFFRAADATGSEWYAPATISLGFLSRPVFHLGTAGGFPAVSLIGNQGTVLYVKAQDAAGTAWGPPVSVESSTGFREIVMQEVEGRPAVAYADATRLWYRRAADAEGTAWDPRVEVATVAGDTLRNSVTMQIVNGRPAIGYFHGRSGILKYARAANAAGSVWEAAITVVHLATAGSSQLLAVVNGSPAAAYLTGADHLQYVQATDSDGATPTVWSVPVFINSNSNFKNPALFDADGFAALACHDTHRGGLQFLRATGAGPYTTWLTEWKVMDMSDLSLLSDGVVRDFGHVRPNESVFRKFQFYNANNMSAAIQNLQIFTDGPDAAEFAVINPGVSALGGGMSVQAQVTFQPVTPGRKSAVLRATGTSAGSPVRFSIQLTGDTDPDLTVEGPGNRLLADGDTVLQTITPPGSFADAVFSVKNTGGTPLRDLAVTFDGPGAAEFSAIPGPWSQTGVEPGMTTSFTVRHTPVTHGIKTAVLRLASNVSGTRNPFDVTLRAVAGQTDLSFVANPINPTCLALQPDGKILVGGTASLDRFHRDGSPDPTFFSPPVGDGIVHAVAVQRDGRILLCGDFVRVAGQPRPGLARVHSDGALDHTFAPSFSIDGQCLAVQPDGKILAGGEMRFGGPRLVRLHPDGSLDTSFSVSPERAVFALALQPDGKILAGGEFVNVSGVPARLLVRLLPNGNLDDFSPVLANEVTEIGVQADGKILVVSSSTVLDRLLPDGTRDPSLHHQFNSHIHTLAVQADGKCLVGGESWFGTALSGFIRIDAGGAIDANFVSNPNSSLLDAALQADGKVMLAGRFESLNGVPRSRLARVDNEAAFTHLTTAGPSAIRWLRSGTAPELNVVWFEVKPEGSTDWQMLGTGVRIPGGWERTGLALPASGSVRALGYAGGSLMESVAPIGTPLEIWRVQYFGSASGTGEAADDADPDGDGLTNFMEFAFGLSPVDRASHALPEFRHQGTVFTAAFTAPGGRQEVAYDAEWSDSLLPGSWRAVPDSGTEESHVFSVPANDQRVFVRFAVRMR